MTLYLEEETGDIAGFVIKNISRILNRVASRRVAHSFVIRDGEICLQALFTAMFAGNKQTFHYVREYERVTDIARENQLDKVRIPSMLEKAHTPKVHETLGV